MTRKAEPSGFRLWIIVLLALIDDVAAVALVFIILWVLDVNIPVYLLVIIGVLAGTFIFIVHHAVVSSLRRRRVTGKEGMIGGIGEVTQALTPHGVIKVNDEYWQAKSVNGDIFEGEEVEIVSINGLKLEVERK